MFYYMMKQTLRWIIIAKWTENSWKICTQIFLSLGQSFFFFFFLLWKFRHPTFVLEWSHHQKVVCQLGKFFRNFSFIFPVYGHRPQHRFRRWHRLQVKEKKKKKKISPKFFFFPSIFQFRSLRHPQTRNHWYRGSILAGNRLLCASGDPARSVHWRVAWICVTWWVAPDALAWCADLCGGGSGSGLCGQFYSKVKKKKKKKKFCKFFFFFYL